ncbi:MAG: type I-C CRISPR-associated protein Cas5c [Spirochaetes bacterium]|jgi:CRISPR-associated protein Cas5d|nr:type I-C CRISPR-associated protein Cas5c [Spirochaetota bacterium]
MLYDEIVRVKVSGDYACFTRPDLKVERMSYPCMTPSAARGILDSILWKPEFQWYVRRILVMNPVRFTSIKRNEIKSKQAKTPLIIENIRAQRNSIILKDVSYIIEASVYQDPVSEQNPPKKYTEMFKRRVKKGQCYRRPFFGTREFAVEFETPNDKEIPISETIPIGSMLFDIFYDEEGIPAPFFFYDVAIVDGVLECPEEENLKMMKSSHKIVPVDYEHMSIIEELHHSEEA